MAKLDFVIFWFSAFLCFSFSSPMVETLSINILFSICLSAYEGHSISKIDFALGVDNKKHFFQKINSDVSFHVFFGYSWESLLSIIAASGQTDLAAQPISSLGEILVNIRNSNLTELYSDSITELCKKCNISLAVSCKRRKLKQLDDIIVLEFTGQQYFHQVIFILIFLPNFRMFDQ